MHVGLDPTSRGIWNPIRISFPEVIGFVFIFFSLRMK